MKFCIEIERSAWSKQPPKTRGQIRTSISAASHFDEFTESSWALFDEQGRAPIDSAHLIRDEEMTVKAIQVTYSCEIVTSLRFNGLANLRRIPGRMDLRLFQTIIAQKQAVKCKAIRYIQKSV